MNTVTPIKKNGLLDDRQISECLSSKQILLPDFPNSCVQLQKVRGYTIDSGFVYIDQDYDDKDMINTMSRSELEATGIPANYDAVLIGHSALTGVAIFGMQKKYGIRSLVSAIAIGDIYAHTS